jgi:hypothetical protein
LFVILKLCPQITNLAKLKNAFVVNLNIGVGGIGGRGRRMIHEFVKFLLLDRLQDGKVGTIEILNFKES